MAPGLVTAEKAARGKLPTDVWWHTIVPTNGREKTGYPTQKPEGIVRRMVQASTKPGDWCLDFAGSGTLGAVASALGRRYVLIDSIPMPSKLWPHDWGSTAKNSEPIGRSHLTRRQMSLAKSPQRCSRRTSEARRFRPSAFIRNGEKASSCVASGKNHSDVLAC